MRICIGDGGNADVASAIASSTERSSISKRAAAEANLLRNGADAMPVALWSRPISIGDTMAMLVRLTDLSIHHRVEQIAAAERFARSVLEQATEAVVVLSRGIAVGRSIRQIARALDGRHRQ
jgi:hypothetical protein